MIAKYKLEMANVIAYLEDKLHNNQEFNLDLDDPEAITTKLGTLMDQLIALEKPWQVTEYMLCYANVLAVANNYISNKIAMLLFVLL